MICMDKFKQDDNCQSSPKGKRVITAIQSSLTHKPLPQLCQINDTHLISIIKAIGFRVFHSVRQSTPLTVAWTTKHYPQAHTHTQTHTPHWLCSAASLICPLLFLFTKDSFKCHSDNGLKIIRA